MMTIFLAERRIVIITCVELVKSIQYENSDLYHYYPTPNAINNADDKPSGKGSRQKTEIRRAENIPHQVLYCGGSTENPGDC
ncbi:MAG TPA: hypothetical protein VFI70_11765 [Nitrososphaeraceae archaeon]|nr:hypothetical protein [Nitrososphaeraceae archaeon]